MRWLMVLLLAACAAQPEPAAPDPRPSGPDALLPGSIGMIADDHRPGGLVVAALREDGPAAAAGVRTGDVVLRYNGLQVRNLREFNRWVLDTPPGSIARIELMRDGERRVVEVPVRELDVMPRV